MNLVMMMLSVMNGSSLYRCSFCNKGVNCRDEMVASKYGTGTCSLEMLVRSDQRVSHGGEIRARFRESESRRRDSESVCQ
jgi:hypothetical protein